MPGAQPFHRTREARLATVASIALVLVAGIAMFARPALVFERFDSQDLIPLAVVLDVVGWAGWGASIVVCFHLTALRRAGGATSRLRQALVAALCVPALYVPVMMVAFVGPVTLGWAVYRVSPRVFSSKMTVGSFVEGLAMAAVFSVVAFVWSFASERLFSKGRRSLGFDLFLTWVCVFGVAFAYRMVAR